MWSMKDQQNANIQELKTKQKRVGRHLPDRDTDVHDNITCLILRIIILVHWTVSLPWLTQWPPNRYLFCSPWPFRHSLNVVVRMNLLKYNSLHQSSAPREWSAKTKVSRPQGPALSPCWPHFLSSSLCSLYPANWLLAVTQTHQAGSHPNAFVPAIPSAYNSFPRPDGHSFSSHLISPSWLLYLK